jgi:hypothetical protein
MVSLHWMRMAIFPGLFALPFSCLESIDPFFSFRRYIDIVHKLVR